MGQVHREQGMVGHLPTEQATHLPQASMTASVSERRRGHYDMSAPPKSL